MDYALIENGAVVNLIWLHYSNVDEFPGAVAIGDRPVSIGDTYTDGVFTRDGVPVRTSLETANDIITGLDAAVVELEYKNVMLELGI